MTCNLLSEMTFSVLIHDEMLQIFSSNPNEPYHNKVMIIITI